MSHEQSETIEKDGRWYNVYGKKVKGKAGKVLPGEEQGHMTVDEAVDAARKRSKSFDRHNDIVPHKEKEY